MIKIYNGYCLKIMSKLQDKSIDAIITDPPYGTTACKWDSVIPFGPMWEQLKRIIKPNGAIVLFGSQPFTSMLVNSNIKWFRHEWIWVKNRGGNFANLKHNPFKEHENIIVFGKSVTTYNPIKQERPESGKSRMNYDFQNKGGGEGVGRILKKGRRTFNKNFRNPSSVQKFNTETGFHPTQKPVALMEYLIKTYTNEGETVLDFTMGSGTTLIACKKTNRNGIGIEQDKKYCEIAKERLKSVDSVQVDLF